MQFAPAFPDEPEGITPGGMVETIAPGVSAKPELYALAALGVLAYKHRDKLLPFFRRLTGRAR